jgi:hypothetical protein
MMFYCILISAFCWLKHRYSPDDQITDDKMDRACGAHGGKDKLHLVKKSEGKRLLRIPLSGTEDDIEINPTIGWDRIHLAQDMHKWCALVNTGMHIQVPQNVGNFSTS